MNLLRIDDGRQDLRKNSALDFVGQLRSGTAATDLMPFVIEPVAGSKTDPIRLRRSLQFTLYFRHLTKPRCQFTTRQATHHSPEAATEHGRTDILAVPSAIGSLANLTL